MAPERSAPEPGAFPQSCWISLLLAVPGALPWAFCFGRDARLLLPWLALTPLVLLAERRHGALWGWAHGTTTWLITIPWIAPTLAEYGDLGQPLGAVLLVLLCLYLGSYHAAFVWLAARAWRRRGAWGLLVGAPAIWVLLELVRHEGLGGFPWNLAGYAWIEMRGALPLSSWVGALGVSYLVVLAATGFAIALAERHWEPLAIAVLLPLLALVSAERWAAPGPASGPPRRIAIVQPNTPILVSSQQDLIRQHYDRLLTMTVEACRHPALLLWPESAAWPYALERDARLGRDVQAIVGTRCALLLNSARWRNGQVFNTAFLITPDDERQSYDKRRLVPFGEYVPLESVLPFVATLARNAGRFTPGRSAAPLTWSGLRLGVSICFEITFAAEIADSVRAGANVLATLTNDAWYGDSWAPWQHLRAARFRAAENRRPVLRAALTGVSALIGPKGEVQRLLGVGERGTIEASVRGHDRLTPFTRRPWAVPALLLPVAAFAIFAPRRRP